MTLTPCSTQNRDVVKKVMVFERDANFDPANPSHPLFKFLEDRGVGKCSPWSTPRRQVPGCPDLMSEEWMKELDVEGLRYAVTELHPGDLYIIPRGVVHFFRTTKVPHVSIGWNTVLGVRLVEEEEEVERACEVDVREASVGGADEEEEGKERKGTKRKRVEGEEEAVPQGVCSILCVCSSWQDKWLSESSENEDGKAC